MIKRMIRYLEATPLDMQEMLRENPIAYVPFGALEWHGEHNVLGLDGLKAVEICERAAKITGGVVFPCVHWGAFDPLTNFPYTFTFPRRPLYNMTRSMVEQLHAMGFRIVILLAGHYPPTQIKQLRKIAEKYSQKYPDFFVLGIPEYFLVPDLDYLGEHAAMCETSCMLAIDPGYVHLERIPENLNFAERAIRHGIFGKDPRNHASRELGTRLLDEIVRRLSDAILQVNATKSHAPFSRIYADFEKTFRKTFNFYSMDKIYANQGISGARDGWEFFKWMVLKKKRYDPNYIYPKKNR